MKLEKILSIIILLLVSAINPFSANQVESYEKVIKVYSELTTLYSFTDSIEYMTLSQNGEKVVFLTKSKRNQNYSVYVASSNGMGIKEVFSSGKYKVGSEEIYLEPVQNLPYISGDSSKIILGLRASKSISSKNDYFLVYDVKSGKREFIPLRILIKGSEYIRFPRANLNHYPFYSTDYSAKKIVSQVEIGVEGPLCNVYDFAIVIMNIDGTNQKTLIGPTAFVSKECSFMWSDYPKSPHYPSLSYDGKKVVFYGKVFMSEDPIDRTGELFVINSDGSNLRQITSSKRFDRKIESLGQYLLNYYGSRIYFKSFNNGSIMLSSISIDGGEIQNHIEIPENSPFFISGDGRKIFFISEKLSKSLVYYDIMKETTNLVLDYTFSGKPNNYGTLNSLEIKNLANTNLTNFSGNYLLIKNSVAQNDWVYSISIDEKLSSDQELALELKVNNPTAKVGERLISLDVAPYIKNGRVMVPAKLIGDIFSAKVIWYDRNQSCYIRYNGNLLIFYLKKDYIWFNGENKKMEVTPDIKSGRIFVPIKTLSEYMNLKLDWNGKSQTLRIERKA
jgi:hypothetical protein